MDRWISAHQWHELLHDSLKKRHKWLIFRKIKVFYATAYIDWKRSHMVATSLLIELLWLVTWTSIIGKRPMSFTVSIIKVFQIECRAAFWPLYTRIVAWHKITPLLESKKTKRGVEYKYKKQQLKMIVWGTRTPVYLLVKEALYPTKLIRLIGILKL